jgi:hypothetical protein
MNGFTLHKHKKNSKKRVNINLALQNLSSHVYKYLCTRIYLNKYKYKHVSGTDTLSAPS